MSHPAAAAKPADHSGRGIALMLGSMFIFTCQDSISKLLAAEYAVPQIMMVRYMVFCLIALWMARRMAAKGLGGGLTILRSKRPVWQMARVLSTISLTAVFILALRYMPIADAHAVLALSPVLVTALSVPLLGEAVGMRRWLAVLAGCIGMLVILRPGLGVMQPASLIALGGAFLYATYMALTRKVASHDRPETSFALIAVTGMVITGAIGPFYWEAPDLRGWTMMVLLGCSSALGHFLLSKAMECAPAAILQPFNYTQLVWAMIIGLIIFGEFPDSFTILGGAIIAASGIYTAYRERRR